MKGLIKMKYYKAVIIPTVPGGNIEVKISANSSSQAKKLIETLPYFKSFVKQPLLEDMEDNNLNKLSNLIKKAQAKDQAKLASMN